MIYDPDALAWLTTSTPDQRPDGRAAFVAAHADDKTVIIPGHGPVTNRANVLAFRDMLQTARDRIAKAKASGMTEQQVVDANLLADLERL